MQRAGTRVSRLGGVAWGLPLLLVVVVLGGIPVRAAEGAELPKLSHSPLPPLDDPAEYRRPWPTPGWQGSPRAARTMFFVGALWDGYTTKRGLDIGLQEGNPLAKPFTDRSPVMAIAVSKALVFAAFELVGRNGRPKSRDTLLATTGLVQLGAGLANRDLIRATEVRKPASPGSSESRPGTP